VPGLPPASWVAGLEASRHADGTVFAAFDNHRSDNYRNYLYRSTDFGQTWTSILGDLPPERGVLTIREDPKNARLLYLGTEMGFFLSPDGGQHWIELKNNMPTLAVNDFAIHPRDNDLVLATHGRGVWILDHIAALQELTPGVLASDAHLFSIEPAEMVRYSDPYAHAGDMIFRGQNPPAGAIIDYYLRDGTPQEVKLTVHDAAGNLVTAIAPTTLRGINRVVWDLRYPSLASTGGGSDQGRPRGAIPGPFVLPGEFAVRLAVGGRVQEQKIHVREDQRIQIAPDERKAWTDALLGLAQLYRDAASMLAAVRPAFDKLPKPAEGGKDTPQTAEIRQLYQLTRELQTRLGTLYQAVGGATGVPTADQRAQAKYLEGISRVLDARVRAIKGV
jgi:hypothetical protein